MQFFGTIFEYCRNIYNNYKTFYDEKNITYYYHTYFLFKY